LAASTAVTPLDETDFQKLISANRGKVVVVNFWATWCAPCRSEMPQLLAFGKRLEAKGGKLFVVSADEQSDATKVTGFLESVHAPVPHYIKRAVNDEKFI